MWTYVEFCWTKLKLWDFRFLPKPSSVKSWSQIRWPLDRLQILFGASEDMLPQSDCWDFDNNDFWSLSFCVLISCLSTRHAWMSSNSVHHTTTIRSQSSVWFFSIFFFLIPFIHTLFLWLLLTWNSVSHYHLLCVTF